MFLFIKKIFYCLSDQDKKKIAPLSILILFNSCIELIGIGAFLPLLTLILSKEKFYASEFYIFLSDKINFFNYNITFLFIFLIVLFFILRFFFQIFYYLTLQKFLHSITLNSSRKLINIFFNQNYQESLNYSPSKMFKDLFTEINVLKGNVFIITRGLSDIILVISIVLLMIYYDPKVTLFTMLILAPFYLIYALFSKNYLKRLGDRRYYHNEKLIKVLNQALNSLRDLKFLNYNNFFVNKFLHHKDNKNWSIVKSVFVNQFIVFLSELLFVLIFSIAIIFFLIKNIDPENLLISLGFYTVCLFRLMPMFGKIYDSYQVYKFNSKSAHEMYEKFKNKKIFALENFENKEISSSEELVFSENIIFKDIIFNHERNSKFNLNIKDLKIRKREFLGIFGKSGSGKSTFINLLSGLINPTSGSIYSDKKNINSNIKSWRDKIGFVSQNIYLFDDTIEKNINLVSKNNDLTHFKNILRICELEELYSKYGNYPIGENSDKISGGEKQRIGIARALYKNPEILILDEPTSSLDDDMSEKFLSSLFKLKEKITCVMISHNKQDFKNFDRVIEIDNGEIKNKI